jgi:hypothetical protein
LQNNRYHLAGKRGSLTVMCLTGITETETGKQKRAGYMKYPALVQLQPYPAGE